jgi:SAM-dependent methyltransferase
MNSKNLFQPEWRRAAGSWPVDLREDTSLRKSFDVLRQKWSEIPFSQYERRQSTGLLLLSDSEILQEWTQGFESGSSGKAFSSRGWYHELYCDALRGKKILDVGCGMAPDTLYYASHGARVTFVDIVEPNVALVERLCKLKGIRDASFCFMRDLESLANLPRDFDVLYCCGSLINAPLEVSRIEAQALLQHLPVGGRWIELGYPKARWEREGRLHETQWGRKTDGGAPWVEWHDLAKLNYLLSPATFDVVLNIEFNNSDFNWFDLIRRT